MAGKKKTIVIRVLAVIGVVFVTAAITWQVAVHSFTGDQYLLTKEQMDRFSQYQKIEEIIDQVNKNYYTEVSQADLITGAYKGTVLGTGDRYSEYLTQEEMERYNRLATGKFFGIGIKYTINAETGYPEVKETVANSPAEKAGLKAADVILEIDGNSAQGINTEQINGMIAGEKGSKVKLKIRRDNEEQQLEVERAEIDQEVVFSEIIDGHIGYVHLSQFTGGSADKVEKAFKDLQKQGCSDFILDLRNNSGGVLSEAVDLADFLMPAGRITYTKNKEGVEEVYDSKGSGFGKPLVVLVNGYSASASEILAGALQQSKTAKLVGSTTYGKGVVQKLYPMKDGKSWLKLTNSVYYLANGDTPNDKGITPDQTVEMDVKHTFDKENDRQLDKAVELLG